MGILRADRITGLGGANAITGSVFLGGKQRIVIDAHDDFNFSNNDFTLECWINFSGFDATGFDTIAWGGSDGTANTRSIQWDYKNSSNELRLVTSVSDSGTVYASSFTALKDVWYHLAVCRSSSDLKLFVNGAQIGSTHNIGSDVIDYDTVPFNIGMRPGNDDRGVIGHISNFRIINGTALYTSNFSVPTTRLTSVPNTALLCCQSSGNIFEDQSLVKKKFTFHRNNTNDALPQASKFTPNSPVGFSTTTDVGSQYGTTFDGFANFATSSYMVPPGGNTRERNRGRALFGGGSTIDNTIQSLSIQSQGNTEDFGDLSTGRYETECASSSTRGIWGGGYTESPNVKVDVIEFVTIANSSNTTDFGNLTVARGHLAGMCNSTRGVFANGSTDPGPNVNTLDYITIATAGNATDFGDSTTASKPMGGGRSSTTRGIFTLGNAPSAVNTIEYITIATTANSQDFGDLTGFSGWGKGAGNISSGTRAILAGGHEALNNIEYITIASLGNGTDFGDLIVGRRSPFTAGSKTRGVFGGGKNPSQLNNIEYVEIATTGNALDFGDMINSKSFSSGLSDCHGGLSE
tara:strand:- start:2748 stop:4478 length:1731 start_codon:yes stop_codon:yes gene_type:complete